MKTRRNFASPDYQSVKSPEDLQRFASAHAKAAADSANSVIPDLVNLFQKNKDVQATLKNGLSIQDNLDCDIVTITWSAIDTLETVSHSLGSVPSGYLVLSMNEFGNIAQGTFTDTSCGFYWLTHGLATSPVTAKIAILR